ncbi:hypothetical protein [Kutzneria sp. 744]|uniref:hypothetical protein n=1 Tax=Kutzneria sp. (strain 744) TaxID=345341 RepID=UPI001E30A0C6|nr:hypothetical protein [Kutzneria sp. 744]
MSDVHGQAGLADAAGAGDHPHPARVPLGPQAVRHPDDVLGAPGQRGHGRRQLAPRGPGRLRPRWHADRLGRTTQHGLVQRPELGVRVDAQLVGQHLAAAPVRVQGLRLLPAVVQSQDQLSPEPLA